MESNHSPAEQKEIEDIFPDVLPVFALIIVTFIFTMIVGGISMLFLGKTGIFLSEIIIILPALLFVIVARAPILKVFRIQLPTAKILKSSFFLAIGVSVLADQVDRFIQAVFPMPEMFAKAMQEMLTIHSVSDGIIIIFSAVLVAGLCEEMLFRGLFQGTLEAKLNAPLALLMSAAVFALIHLMPWTLIQILLFGFVLAYLAYKSGSIIPGAIVHAGNNFLAIIIYNLGAEKTQWYLSGVLVNPIILLIAAILVLVGIKPFIELKKSTPVPLQIQ